MLAKVSRVGLLHTCGVEEMPAPTRTQCEGCVHPFAPHAPEPYCDREGGSELMHLRDDHNAWTAAHQTIMVWDHDEASR